MKKSFFAALALLIVSIFFIVIFVDHDTQKSQYIADFPKGETPEIKESPKPKPIPPTTPSASFMTGYWDGWHGKWLGPVRWTASNDYRQGHMLGSYDRKNNITRYPAPK
jgi:hypothetical protein